MGCPRALPRKNARVSNDCARGGHTIHRSSFFHNYFFCGHHHRLSVIKRFVHWWSLTTLTSRTNSRTSDMAVSAAVTAELSTLHNNTGDTTTHHPVASIDQETAKCIIHNAQSKSCFFCFFFGSRSCLKLSSNPPQFRGTH